MTTDKQLDNVPTNVRNHSHDITLLHMYTFNFVIHNKTKGDLVLCWNIESCTLLLQGCKARGIKLWAAIAAAGMISAYTSKNLPQYQGEKYAVVTLSDCRSILEPPLTPNDFGKPHFFAIS